MLGDSRLMKLIEDVHKAYIERDEYLKTCLFDLNKSYCVDLKGTLWEKEEGIYLYERDEEKHEFKLYLDLFYFRNYNIIRRVEGMIYIDKQPWKVLYIITSVKKAVKENIQEFYYPWVRTALSTSYSIDIGIRYDTYFKYGVHNFYKDYVLDITQLQMYKFVEINCGLFRIHAWDIEAIKHSKLRICADYYDLTLETDNKSMDLLVNVIGYLEQNRIYNKFGVYLILPDKDKNGDIMSRKSTEDKVTDWMTKCIDNIKENGFSRNKLLFITLRRTVSGDYKVQRNGETQCYTEVKMNILKTIPGFNEYFYMSDLYNEKR